MHVHVLVCMFMCCTYACMCACVHEMKQFGTHALSLMAYTLNTLEIKTTLYIYHPIYLFFKIIYYDNISHFVLPTNKPTASFFKTCCDNTALLLSHFTTKITADTCVIVTLAV